MIVFHTSNIAVPQPDVHHSRTFQLISQGIADLHCRSDRYLAEEVEREMAMF